MKSAVLLLAVFVAGAAFAKGGGGHSSGYRSTMPSDGTGSKSAHKHVGGYIKHDGTYVAPHNRSTADHTKNNNWDTKGNHNLDTGKPGTKRGDE
jgi:hypothetical protein